MKFVRWFLGKLILFFNAVFSPTGIKRDPAEQAAIDAQTKGLTLYQFEACPFCVKVRRSMKRMSLSIQTRDAKRDNTAREELQNGGGQVKVPCLKIAHDDGREEWMYESSDIIQYLEGRFAPQAA